MCEASEVNSVRFVFLIKPAAATQLLFPKRRCTEGYVSMDTGVDSTTHCVQSEGKEGFSSHTLDVTRIRSNVSDGMFFPISTIAFDKFSNPTVAMYVF